VTKVPKRFQIVLRIIKSAMNEALKTLRLVHAAMLGAVVLEALVAEIAGPTPGAVNPALSYALATVSVAIVGTVFVVRKTLALPSAHILAQHTNDSVALQQWKVGHLLTYGLCQGLGVFGVVLRFLGASFQQCLPFYVGGFIMLFFFAPRDPAAGPHPHDSGHSGVA
jgi:hypothetical protein